MQLSGLEALSDLNVKILAANLALIFVLSFVVVSSAFQNQSDHVSLSEEKADSVQVKEFDPNLTLEISSDRLTGYNLLVNSTGLDFAPRNVNQYHVPGEGHSHLYIDGVKVDRLYSKYHYIYKLPKQKKKANITVTLHSNDHRMYYEGDNPVMDSKMIFKSQ